MNQTGSPIIHLRDVSLTLRSSAGMVPILHALTLSVDAGETVAIIGPSGSGKTSMMMLIAGLEAPSGGQVEVCGENIGGQSEDALARFRAANIGIVFQSFHLIPTMTAWENVAIPLEFSATGKQELAHAREQAAQTLGKLGLSHRLHHYPAQLSGGEQQRVAIARAFVSRPKLLLADEPTGNLDQDTGEQVMQLLFDLQKEHGTTLLLITHDPALAARCRRVIRLSDGAIAGH